MIVLKLDNGKTVNLSLEYYPFTDDVTVIACDENGDRCWQGDLITFKSNGKILRENTIGKDLGFQLDEIGEIKLEED